MHKSHCYFLTGFRLNLFLVVILSILLNSSSYAQEDIPDYDELGVEMNIPDLGVYEILIAIKDQDAYMPISDLFDLLKIKNEETTKGVEGFIIHPDSTYIINPIANLIEYKNKTFELEPVDFIQSQSTLYLRSNLFGEIFGLNTNFSFRSLSIKLDTEKDLPVIKAMRLLKLRDNLDRVKGITVPDTIISRNYPFFKAGSLDWGLVNTQQSAYRSDTRLSLGLGTMFLGGETNLLLNYSTQVPFNSRNQFYQWRFVNNDSKFFKQITAGRIFTQATSSLFAPVSGVQITNSPFQNRRSFGTYILSDYTDARWTVELYVNNVLISFTKADDSGFYTFDVPLMYGNTAVRLKFYGPYGEERIEERLINIPYNFVPKNELEYTLSAGIVENETLNRFSRLNFNYGLGNSMTIGGGAEYYSGIMSAEVMPFINTSIRLASNLLFTGEYMYGVKGEAFLSYRTPKNLQVDFNYIKYDEDQTAINFNYLEERKISFSAPIRSKNISLFSRFSINQIIMPTTEFTTAQLLLSGVVMGVSTNLTTYGIYNDRTKEPTIYSALSQSYRLPYNFLFSPRIQYDFSRNQFNNINLEIERSVFNQGFINLAYENNLLRNAHIFEVGIRYAFDFAQTSATARLSNLNTSFVQSARGSLMLDDKAGYVLANNRSAMSKAALTLIPFLDYNGNGLKDAMEPGVRGVQLKNNTGRTTYNKDETVIRITELQPYIDIILEVDPNSLDNIAWKVKHEKIAIQTLPNQFQQIEVPIDVLGEVSGMVYFKENKSIKGQGRILVNILNSKGDVVAEVLTEGDGYFTYLGLKPGKYTAQINKDQLNTLNYSVKAENANFEIEVSEYGDIKDDLEFTLQSRNQE